MLTQIATWLSWFTIRSWPPYMCPWKKFKKFCFLSYEYLGHAYICFIEAYELCNSNTLRWRHNDRDGISNHQPHDCLLNRLFRRISKKTSKLCVTGLCAGNSPCTGEFPAQMASNVENVSIWWRHHEASVLLIMLIRRQWCLLGERNNRLLCPLDSITQGMIF